MASTGEDAVRAATGRGWQEWFEVLDQWGARERGHAATARYLGHDHRIPGWWSQEIAVRYERERGLRAEGQVADGSFQVGVRRILSMSPEEAWDRVRAPGWLGEGAPRALRRGEDYTLTDGTTGTVRVVRDGSHVRLTWQPPGWERPSTLQVRVVPATRGRATVAFHHEKLPDAEAREAMLERWRGVLEALGG